MTMASCQTSPREKIQGVFSVDKTSLKSSLTEEAGNDNALGTALLDKALKTLMYLWMVFFLFPFNRRTVLKSSKIWDSMSDNKSVGFKTLSWLIEVK